MAALNMASDFAVFEKSEMTLNDFGSDATAKVLAYHAIVSFFRASRQGE
jgi:hypothetical protein